MDYIGIIYQIREDIDFAQQFMQKHNIRAALKISQIDITLLLGEELNNNPPHPTWSYDRLGDAVSHYEKFLGDPTLTGIVLCDYRKREILDDSIRKRIFPEATQILEFCDYDAILKEIEHKLF